jgi:hypothetical protein
MQCLGEPGTSSEETDLVSSKVDRGQTSRSICPGEILNRSTEPMLLEIKLFCSKTGETLSLGTKIPTAVILMIEAIMVLVMVLL